MIHAFLHQLLDIARALEWCRFNTLFDGEVPLSPEEQVQIKEQIGVVLHAAIVLGLKATEAKAERIIASVETVPRKDLFREILELQSRFDDEADGIIFLYLSSKRQRFYNPRESLFGDDVNDAFPSAIMEIEEAGACLALERPTACVFHLMRAVEASLKVLAKTLGIPYAPNWESYLDQIRSIVETKWSKRTPKQKREHVFYSEAHAHLSSLKVAWRNPTMHVVKSYTLEQSEEVFNSVRVFMRHLATKLKEGKK